MTQSFILFDAWIYFYKIKLCAYTIPLYIFLLSVKWISNVKINENSCDGNYMVNTTAIIVLRWPISSIEIYF
jgi:hypothetical protein